ncbi:hypothetical protein C8Q75DRAFT_224750 [Abortiporus biennis]|nr:hypothetical protein C8Q75DRAFT_224750 [Abortiporus biennis]
MHPVFLINEIFQTILQNLDGNRDNRENRVALAALARTCKAVSDAALDTLWYRQTDILPIVRILGDAIGERSVWDHLLGRHRTSLVLSRNVLTPEHYRFDIYAKRIHSFSVAFGIRNCEIDDSVIQHIMQWSHPLFPNLRELLWPVKGISHSLKGQLPVLSLFLSPCLHTLNLSLENNQLSQTVFSSLHKQCPNLTRLSLDGKYKSIGTSTLGNYLQDALQLQQIAASYGEIPYKWTHTMAILPHLTSLSFRTFCLPSDLQDSESLALSRTGSFPALVTLEIFTEDLQTLFFFMLQFSFPRLSTLNITVEMEEFLIEPHFGKLTRLIAEQCSPNHLIYFSLQSVDFRGRNVGEDSVPICGDALHPLFRFHKMEEFSVIGRWIISLDDDFLRDLAQTWRNLTALQLFPTAAVWKLANKSITLKALLPLAQYCLNLEDLDLYLDTESNDPPPLTDNIPSLNRVGHLALRCCLSNEHTLEYIRFLKHLFPNVHSIELWPTSATGGDKKIFGARWDEVEEQLG